jgi:putative oxygen-independent coproporphyrinogen III oxidase
LVRTSPVHAPGSPLADEAGDQFGVYVHVPFCSRRCDYCAFATFTDRHHLAGAYLEAVRDDVLRAVDAGMRIATSVFVGGGTPSQVDPRSLGEVIAAIPKRAGAEVTVECNPDDVTEDLLSALVASGVNRVSLGVQSTSRHVLAMLGRTHDPESVVCAVGLIRDSGLATFNLDLIYGGAGETLADWERTVADVVGLGAPHVSAYALTIEPGTPLAADATRHPDEDDLADKYLAADAAFSAAGLENYEISNWAVPGHECRHNWLYWLQGDYAAFGSAAHGHESGRRWWNVRTPERYIELVRARESVESSSEHLDNTTRAYERADLRLRTRLGLSAQDLTAEDLAELDALLMRTADGRLVLTPAGRLLANVVSMRLRVSPG